MPEGYPHATALANVQTEDRLPGPAQSFRPDRRRLDEPVFVTGRWAGPDGRESAAKIPALLLERVGRVVLCRWERPASNEGPFWVHVDDVTVRAETSGL